MAMRDRRMNKMMMQSFPGTILSCDMRELFILQQAKPSVLDEPDVPDTYHSDAEMARHQR